MVMVIMNHADHHRDDHGDHEEEENDEEEDDDDDYFGVVSEHIVELHANSFRSYRREIALAAGT